MEALDDCLEQWRWLSHLIMVMNLKWEDLHPYWVMCLLLEGKNSFQAFSFSLLNTPQWKCWQRGANMFSWGLPSVPAAETFWETVIPAKAAGSWPSAYCAVQRRTKWNVQYIGQWHVSSSLSAFNPSAFKGFRNNKRMMWLPNLHDSLLIAGNLWGPTIPAPIFCWETHRLFQVSSL